MGKRMSCPQLAVTQNYNTRRGNKNGYMEVDCRLVSTLLRIFYASKLLVCRLFGKIARIRFVSHQVSAWRSTGLFSLSTLGDGEHSLPTFDNENFANRAHTKALVGSQPRRAHIMNSYVDSIVEAFVTKGWVLLRVNFRRNGWYTTSSTSSTLPDSF